MTAVVYQMTQDSK